VPHQAEDYVHRIGRTGRAGRTGIAYTLATEADAENLAEVEKLIRQKIQRYGDAPEVLAPAPAVAALDDVTVPDAAAAAETPADQPARKRRRGGRGRKRESGDAAVTEPVRTAEPRRAPARAAAPARRDPPRDPIQDYRGGRRDDSRRDDRRDRDEGDSFIGFGEEGIPAFLMHKATLAR